MAERKQTTVKGDRSRVTKTKDYGDTFDGIPNFGFKPKWMRNEETKDQKVSQVPRKNAGDV